MRIVYKWNKIIIICVKHSERKRRNEGKKIKEWMYLNPTYGTLFSSLTFWTGAIDGVETDFCSGIRQTAGVKFRLALSFSKSLYTIDRSTLRNKMKWEWGKKKKWKLI
jgi:hypothetical protein